MFSIFLTILPPIYAFATSCEYGMIQSAWNETCIGTNVVLLGGRNLKGWRKDGEIWAPTVKVDVDFPDFPYPVDAPFGWWSSLGLLVCGGRNWDIDQVETRCWRYDQCAGVWQERAG